ncbi:MAG: hypothetical protein PHX21_01095 [bacterium]|nr:hypothetical protein [bacterium]
MKKAILILFVVLLRTPLFAADIELKYDQDGTRMYGYSCGG